VAKFTLWLTRTGSLALEKTCFFHPTLGCELKAVRGKTPGAFRGYSTFQWTPALQSMLILILRTAALGRENRIGEAVIQGDNGSPASSLDYSIGKTPSWLLDIFGVDRAGAPLAKRLFHRTNPERKRSGPVAVVVNENMLAWSDIAVFINNEPIESPQELLKTAAEIEEIYFSQRANYPSRREKPAEVAIFRRSQGSAANSAPRAGAAGNNMLSCPCCGGMLTLSFLSAKIA
jgi:hypothetical protein